jgi:hypothetical protein
MHQKNNSPLFIQIHVIPSFVARSFIHSVSQSFHVMWFRFVSFGFMSFQFHIMQFYSFQSSHVTWSIQLTLTAYKGLRIGALVAITHSYLWIFRPASRRHYIIHHILSSSITIHYDLHDLSSIIVIHNLSCLLIYNIYIYNTYKAGSFHIPSSQDPTDRMFVSQVSSQLLADWTTQWQFLPLHLHLESRNT